VTRLSRHTIVGQPLDYPERVRFVHDAPPWVHALAHAEDDAANRCGLGDIMAIVGGLVAGLIFVAAVWWFAL